MKHFYYAKLCLWFVTLNGIKQTENKNTIRILKNICKIWKKTLIQCHTSNINNFFMIIHKILS